MVDNIFKNLHSSSGRYNNWSTDCLLFAKNDYFFTFRSHPTMLYIVEGSPVRVGTWILRRLKKNPIFYSVIDKFSTSDSVGCPKNIINFVFKKRNIKINPTTLRYINNILNLVDLFGEDVFVTNFLDNKVKTIVEIGAGYGGECKIANDFSLYYHNIKIDENWNIFDLDSSLPLIRRWLNEFGYQATLNPNVDSLNNISLIVSNAAFSEMSRNLQEEYFNKIIMRAERGYFIENFGIHSAPFGGFTREEFIDRLKKAGKQVLELDPRTWLSNFDHDAKSGLVVFSDNNINVRARHLTAIERMEIFIRRILLFIPSLPRVSFIQDYLNKKG